MRAHGLIFGKVYIVWVCAPRYKPLSCRKRRIREKRTLKFGSIFVTLLVDVFGILVFEYLARRPSTGWLAGQFRLGFGRFRTILVGFGRLLFGSGWMFVADKALDAWSFVSDHGLEVPYRFGPRA